MHHVLCSPLVYHRFCYLCWYYYYSKGDYTKSTLINGGLTYTKCPTTICQMGYINFIYIFIFELYFYMNDYYFYM